MPGPNGHSADSVHTLAHCITCPWAGRKGSRRRVLPAHPRSLLGGRRGEGRGQLSRQRLQWATGVGGSGGFLSFHAEARPANQSRWGDALGGGQHSWGAGLMVRVRTGMVRTGGTGRRLWEGRGGWVGSVAELGRAMPGFYRCNCPLQKPRSSTFPTYPSGLEKESCFRKGDSVFESHALPLDWRKPMALPCLRWAGRFLFPFGVAALLGRDSQARSGHRPPGP